MNNISVFRISIFQVPHALRRLRLLKMVFVFVSYLQMLALRLEMFIEKSVLEARMTPQVCYLEKILRVNVSPWVEIPRQDLVLFQIGEAGGYDVFINDTTGAILYPDMGYGSAFVINIPETSIQHHGYALDLINKYRLPSTRPQVVFTSPVDAHILTAYTDDTGNMIYVVFDEPMSEDSVKWGKGLLTDSGPDWAYDSLSADKRTVAYSCDWLVLYGDEVLLVTDYENYSPLKTIYGGILKPLAAPFPVTNNVNHLQVVANPDYLVPDLESEGNFQTNYSNIIWYLTFDTSDGPVVAASGTGPMGIIFAEVLKCRLEIAALPSGNGLVIYFRFCRENDPFGDFDGVPAHLDAYMSSQTQRATIYVTL